MKMKEFEPRGYKNANISMGGGGLYYVKIKNSSNNNNNNNNNALFSRVILYNFPFQTFKYKNSEYIFTRKKVSPIPLLGLHLGAG